MTSVLSTSSTTTTANVVTSGSTSSGFNEENFLRKLDNVQPTQDSIQSLALWIIHHKAHHDTICRLWMKKLSDSSNGKQRLALFYLANDVIQNCRRKNAKIFQDTFKLCLIDAVELVRNDSIKKKIERVFDVWSERNVYDQDFILKLNQQLYKEDVDNKMLTRSPPTQPPPQASSQSVSVKSPVVSNSIVLVPQLQQQSVDSNKSELEYQKIIAEFQPKNLRDSISAFFSLQNETNLAKANVEATRLLDINVDHIKQYRDKSQCSKFKIEFENSCSKLEEYILKLNDEIDKRKQLIQLLNQSEIFYDAQFKDATTVYNAYKSYGSKVSLVKRKLDELIITKFNSSDVKLDNLDMEMSEEDEDDDAKLKKSKLNYQKQHSTSSKSSRSSPHHVSSSALASSSNGSIRNNLDPRQNRHSHHSSSSSSNKKSSSSSSTSSSSASAVSKTTQSSTSTKRNKLEDGSNTPVKDEESPVKSTSSNTNNPLDFLTKFINKSSTNTNDTTTPNSTSSSSANLSYLVDSLKKFVNTNNNNVYNETNSYIPQQSSNQYIYDHNMSNQQPYVPQPTPNLMMQQPARSGTPTKDEIYQPQQLIQTMPPISSIPPPLPVDAMHTQPPGPQSPYLPPPSPYHPMMYSPSPTMYPPPPPPPPHPPMYLQGPPPPIQMQQPPNMPLMMIDPNNCYQYPTQSQPNNKMLISPTLSNTSTNSSNSNLNQPNSPTTTNNNAQGYWSNPTTPTGSNQFSVYQSNQLDDSFNDDQMRPSSTNKRNNSFDNNSNRSTMNDYQSSYKRKYSNNNNNNNNYDDSYNPTSYNSNNKPYNNNSNKHQQNQRIPTINSQRDRSSNYADGNNNMNSNISRGANNSGRY